MDNDFHSLNHSDPLARLGQDKPSDPESSDCSNPNSQSMEAGLRGKSTAAVASPSTNMSAVWNLHAMIASVPADDAQARAVNEEWSAFINHYSPYIDNAIANAASHYFGHDPKMGIGAGHFCKTAIYSELFTLFKFNYDPRLRIRTGAFRAFIRTSIQNTVAKLHRQYFREEYLLRAKSSELASRRPGVAKPTDDLVAGEELYNKLLIIIEEEILQYIQAIPTPAEQEKWKVILQNLSVGDLDLLRAFGLVDRERDLGAQAVAATMGVTRKHILAVRQKLLDKIRARILRELQDELDECSQ